MANEHTLQSSGEEMIVRQPIGSVVVEDRHAEFQLLVHLSHCVMQAAYPVVRSWRRYFERAHLSKLHSKALASFLHLAYQIFSDLSAWLNKENCVMPHIDGSGSG